MRSKMFTAFYSSFQSKPCTYVCLVKRHAVQQNCIELRIKKLSFSFDSGNINKYSFISNIQAACSLTFKPRGYLFMRCITFFFDKALSEKSTYQTQNDLSKFPEVLIHTSADNVSNWCKSFPCTIVRRYQIFALSTSVPDTLRVMLKLQINNKNFYSLPWSNKAILDS